MNTGPANVAVAPKFPNKPSTAVNVTTLVGFTTGRLSTGIFPFGKASVTIE